MKTLFIILLGLFVACGQSEPQLRLRDYPQVDTELQPYVSMFMRDCSARRSDCDVRLRLVRTIKVVTMPKEAKGSSIVTLGTCYIGTFSRVIHINREALPYQGRYMQALIYHELAHCMYDLEHETKSGMLMSELMPPLVTLVRDWQVLLDDMFAAIQERHGE